MKHLPENLIREKNKTSTGSSWLVLLEINLNDLENTVFRLVRNYTDIEYQGETYTAFPFELDPTVLDSKGEIPQLTLKVSNITKILQPYLLKLKGAIGSEVKIKVVNSNHLTEDHSELEMDFQVTASHTESDYVVFRLGGTNPLMQRFPLYTYRGLHCRWVFRGAECGYNVGYDLEVLMEANEGGVFFKIPTDKFSVGDKVVFYNLTACLNLEGKILKITRNWGGGGYQLDSETTFISNWDKLSDTGKVGLGYCSRTISDCKGFNNSTRFGGFPGMRNRSVRLV